MLGHTIIQQNIFFFVFVHIWMSMPTSSTTNKIRMCSPLRRRPPPEEEDVPRDTGRGGDGDVAAGAADHHGLLGALRRWNK